MTKIFEKGERAYTLNGREIEVVDGVNCVGQAVYEDSETQEEYLGDVQVFNGGFFKNPPMEKVHVKVDECEKRAMECERRANDARLSLLAVNEELGRNKRLLSEQNKLMELNPDVGTFLSLIREDKECFFVAYHAHHNVRHMPILTIKELGTEFRAEISVKKQRFDEKHISMSMYSSYKDECDRSQRVQLEKFDTMESAIDHIKQWVMSENGDSTLAILFQKEASAKFYGFDFPQGKFLKHKRERLEDLCKRIGKDKDCLEKQIQEAEALRLEVEALEK